MTAARADTVVVGAGPAGAWAAYLLARRGARVIILDPSHPREKPCGGGVTGRALDLVAGALAGHPVETVGVTTARFIDTKCAPRDSLVTLPAGALVVASRARFDGALLAAAIDAGATFIRARASRIERAGGAFTITLADGRTVTGGQLVGADGANSFVRRSLDAPFPRNQLSIATGFFAHGSTSTEIVIELRGNPAGYLWSFPRPDHLAIGICAQADTGVSAGMLKAMAAEWIGRASLAPGARLEPYSWPIPSLASEDFDALEPAGEGWYLVGDAAGLVDPITREGIYFALQSAAFAAEAMLGDAARARRVYRDRVRSEIASDLARAARVKSAFFSSRFTSLFLSSLAESKAIRQVMADLVTGTQPYRTLKWRLATTFEFGLAWRLFTGPRRLSA